jgi:major membrane immunogen (membrane-anchored lipoprotein)
MRIHRYLMGPMVCALVLVVGCGKSEKRAAAGDTAAAAAAGTHAAGTPEVAMRAFHGLALIHI